MTFPKRTVAVTGANGALGRYAALHLRYRSNLEVLTLDRMQFGTPRDLQQAAAAADTIFHLAGVNRAPEDEVLASNPAIARTLVQALDASRTTPHVIYASSTHERGDSIYGRSKRLAGDIIEEWAARTGAKFTRLLLPHLYSELVRPNYNSGIATFCNALTTGIEPQILVDAEITPLHASEVCALFDALLADAADVDLAPTGQPQRMTGILAELTEMHTLYAQQLIVPDLRERRRLHLFNTYRAHLYGNYAPVRPVLHGDNRGNLFEAVRELNGGQSFISTTRPGITRGNHFHFHKVERFCVLRGQAMIALRNMADGRPLSFAVSGEAPCFVDMPTLWTHNITNTGDGELLTLFWAHEIFDPEAADTYFVAV